MCPPKARLFDRATQPRIITLILLAGISALNMSIFLPALPSMAVDLETDYRVIQLSISLYLAFVGLLQLIIGPISDRFGRRPVVLGALGIFSAASLGCYFANTIETFLIYRMAQAAVAAGMVLSRAIIRDVVPMDQAASMLGYVTMGMSLVPMFAPVVGGFLLEYSDWRSIFLFLALMGLALTLLIWLDLGETNITRSISFRSQLSDYPELFRSPRFWGYVLCAATASGCFFAYLGGSPYVASEVYNLPPTTTRYLFGVPAAGYLVGSLMSGRFSIRFGIDRMIWAGCWLLVLGMLASLLVTAAGYGSAYSFFAFCAFVGLGNGLVLPNANAGMLSVRPHLAGTASGIGGAIMIGGGAALAALSGALLERGSGSYPLQWVMFLSAVAGLACIYYVANRTKKIAT